MDSRLLAALERDAAVMAEAQQFVEFRGPLTPEEQVEAMRAGFMAAIALGNYHLLSKGGGAKPSSYYLSHYISLFSSLFRVL